MIRYVRPDDARAICEIYNGYILNTNVTFETEALSVNEMRNRIEEISLKFPYFVHEGDNGVDGYCYVHQLGERAAYEGSVEISIYLSPCSTGKGIGSKLFGHMLEECRRRGYRAVFSLIAEGNEASKAISRKFGFEKVGCLRSAGLKFGKLLDLVYYELLLQNP